MAKSMVVFGLLGLFVSAQGTGDPHQDMLEKLTVRPICFGAAGNSPAVLKYTAKEERVVAGIKLVHKSGQVSCDGVKYSPWGCSMNKNKGISIVITDGFNNVIYPHDVKPIKYKHANQPLTIKVRSEGCNDPGRTGCGQAFIWVNGVDRARKTRGFHFVVIDRKTGRILSVNAFDTNANKPETQNAYNFLKGLKGDKIVLAAIADEGWNLAKQYPIEKELVRLGAIAPFDKTFRASFALIGYAGSRKEPWMKFAQSAPGKGPTIISTTIPMSGESLGYWYTVLGSNEYSKSLLFANMVKPFLIRENDKIKIWYGEDFMNAQEFNNKGKTCMDVYAWYA